MDINGYNYGKAASNSLIGASVIKMHLPPGFVYRAILALIITTMAMSCDQSYGAKSTRGVEVVEETVSSADFGNYYALVIGINDYEQWPNLKFAEKDADDIQNILISQYAFPKENVTFLKNKEATREGILTALRLKLEGLGENDNLLIFYAGHGQLDNLTGNGFWIPSNADLYQAYSWISSSTLQDLLVGPGVKAKAIIVVADACFAGGLLKRAGPSTDPFFTHSESNGDSDNEWYEEYRQKLVEKANKKSRQVIASGGFEEVPDKSDFAAELKQALKTNPYPYIDMKYLFFKEIFLDIKIIGQQEPALSRLKTGPELDGQFVLVKKTDSRAVAPEEDIADIEPETESDVTEPELSAQKVMLTLRSNVVGDAVFIDGKNMGSTRLDVELDPGKYDVRIEKKGYETFEEIIEIATGDELVVRADLKPVHAPLAVIEFYEAKPDDIEPGETSTLTWRTNNAASVNIDSIGDMALSGSVSVKPDKTQTYKITVKNKDSMPVITEATVNVRSAAAPVIDDFSAKPINVQRGRTTVLNWRTANADQVEIKGIGTVQTSGLRRVEPIETQSYTLIAKNKLGQTEEKSITVKVIVPLPEIGLFRADREVIKKGEIVKLNWKTLNAESVLISPIGKNVDPGGSLSVKPAATTTYTLIAKNKEGRVEKNSITVKVDLHTVLITPQLPVFEAVITPEVVIPIPRPQLITIGTKSSYTSGGKRWTRYSLGIKNWKAYPAELFKPAPDLPPCGNNTKSSQTWINIYDATSKKRLYGYCAFSSRKGLAKFSLPLLLGVKTPAKVSVVLHDRRTGKKYSSNAVTPR